MLCHGAEGKGDGMLAEAMQDDWGEAVKPAHLSLARRRARRVKLAMPVVGCSKPLRPGSEETQMPAFDSLPAEDVWDMVHYVQSLRVAAHEVELTEAGLPVEDRQRAGRRIWASLSRQMDENAPVNGRHVIRFNSVGRL